MAVTTENFGKTTTNETIHLYTIKNASGMMAKVTDWGAILVELWTPDKNGKLEDVVLGYDNTDQYLTNPSHFGATIGRSGNRIEFGKFVIDGKTYQLAQNQKGNNLHSGPDGYEYRLWMATAQTDQSVTFSLVSPDGDQGFPGEFRVSVTYTVTDANELTLTYDGSCDQDTVANMTNHSYFNLNGCDSREPVYNHVVELKAEYYTPVADDKAIPTGEIAPVKGTPMDFLTAKQIGVDIGSDFEQLTMCGGYDHNYVLKREKSKDMVKLGEVFVEENGRGMRILTDAVGFQFYSSNFINPDTAHGKRGVVYDKRGAFCIETQYFPNAINTKSFPSPLLKAGENYHTVTTYQFFTK
ncbi:MAG: galactose mutarotase [Lachnospiraceae bacterium]|nr:galactose mutarotase [Lachnospiraceae bacterium]